MANMIARLGVVLGLDSAEFSKNIEAAGKKLEQLSEKAETFGKLGAASFVAMTYKAMEFADSISDVAKANDVAIDTIVKLSDALSQNGGEAENAGKLLASFTAFVDNAAQGSFQAQQSFQKAGIGLKELAKMSTEDLFQKTIEGIASIEDPLTRNAKAMEIFGKAAKGVDFVGLAESMSEVSNMTGLQAKAIQDAGDAWDMLNKHTRDTLLTFTEAIGTNLKSTIEYVMQATEGANAFGTAVKTAFDTAAVLGANVSFVFKAIGGDILAAASAAKALATEGVDAARKIMQTQIELDQKNREQLDAFERKIMGTGGAGRGSANDPRRLDFQKAASIGRAVKPGVDKEAEGIQHTLNKLKEKQASEKLSYDTKQAMFEIDMVGLHMRKEDVDLAKNLFEIDSKRQVMIDEIQRTEKISQKQKNELIEAENKIADAAKRQAEARNEMVKAQREMSFGQGFTDSMDKFFREAPTAMENGGKAFESVVSNMSSALDSFVRTGKFSFADLTASIIRDMISIQMRAQATSLFSMAIGALGFGGKFTPGSNSFVGPMPAVASNASGGDVLGGTPHYVGENGPELFVPSRSGSIIPNSTLAGMGQNQPTVNYNGPYIANMSAIDTQSASQFLAKNKTAVYAANQSASRSIPASR
jgi:lambda family phage tail tape measure protein